MTSLKNGKYKIFSFFICLCFLNNTNSLTTTDLSLIESEETTVLDELNTTTKESNSTASGGITSLPVLENELVPSTLLSALFSSTTSPVPLSLTETTDVEVSDVSKNESICTINNINDAEKGISAVFVDGDFVVTILTTEPIEAAELIVTRINKVGILGETAKLGLRAIQITDFAEVTEFFIKEVQFQQKCIKDSLGIFVTPKIWSSIKSLAENRYPNIWLLPSTEDILFPRISDILYELEWEKQKISIDVRTSTEEFRIRFLQAAEKQHICLKNNPAYEKIYIIIGNEMLNGKYFEKDGTIIAVQMGLEDLDKSYISELPEKSFVLTEPSIELTELDETIDELIPSVADTNKPFKILSSDLIRYSSVLIRITNWLNESINKNCGENLSTTCNDPLNDLNQWKNFTGHKNLNEILEELKFENLSISMNYDLLQKIHVTKPDETDEMQEIASLNFVSNVTTYFHYANQYFAYKGDTYKLGHIFHCENKSDGTNKTEHTINDYDYEYHMGMKWQIKPEAWVAAGLTISILGILMSLSILFFITSRICLEDILEGNPVCSILLLISLVGLFASFIPFALEYSGEMTILDATREVLDIWNSLCAVRIFLLTLCYCITFSILLCRAIMLASIGSEGGFLSHVNGYLQSVICVFSVLVQIGLSTQLLIVMHATHSTISCDNIYYGNWLWGLIAYDGLLLAALVLLAPFYFRSQRNYHEGILILTGALLSLAVWSTWIPLSMLGHQWRAIAVPLGAQVTGWAILGGILIPRSFLIVRGIARSDLAQALPSLTSLAFAQANQYTSEQSVYECVNPAMRQNNFHDDSDPERCPSPSEIPTLPLRGASRGNNLHHIQYSQQNLGPLPVSPSKITRF